MTLYVDGMLAPPMHLVGWGVVILGRSGVCPIPMFVTEWRAALSPYSTWTLWVTGGCN